MPQIKAKIVYNKKVKENYWCCVFNAPEVVKKASPGQFLNIRVEDKELLLRRPFSIHGIQGSGLGIIYEVLGKGTKYLSRRKPGEYLDIIGPLGNGFDYKTQGCQGTMVPVLVAGGMGVAPLFFLAEKLRENQNPKSKIQNVVLIGAKTKNHILCEKEFKAAGFDVRIATDDGSRGFKGYVSELLEKILSADLRHVQSASSKDAERSRGIYACGPKPMLKEICRISRKYGLSSQVSLEEHMACGIGACFGCVAETKEGYKRVCKDGPVFKADDLIW
ncbi:MAG: dihydroorotate dehydrogenase electron transfer subunit [Candidatus Omnitrophota bacterium]|nr:dihydroorotate dehydrogenase electron transfer subunit [Candidatus Omnitrophota bacterium]MBU1929857.1 dihydroorotate dehydrogenase electron transfer subunit [Candidatus Omnitrophota bacterium]MBU2034666.1 dihydroorotate dehydrogenase electron transfer subunit [Candidatus Omnitrophota bacterium]MBU2221992.1 dihydroorotate dehydrogenase electron transfer subunit [Candidatus Omnitrophota bacterium]MBU2258227.1 dihydroorotate dehydrogenase electron transfer subunit [Candidatus Omnitrophota bact